MRTVAPADVGDGLSALVDEVHSSRESVFVTRNGVPIAVVMPSDVYEAMISTLGLSRTLRESHSSASESR